MMRLFRPAALLIAMTAMLLGAMLPGGWMPGAGGQLVMCSLGNPHTAPENGKHKPADDSHLQGGCPFAAAPHLAVPVENENAPRSGPIWTTLAVRPSEYRAQKAVVYAAQAPRAPPAIV